MKRKWTPEEVRAWYEETGTLTYANQEDANLIVRKPRSLGWTVNWANPWTYLLQAGILIAVWGIIFVFS